MFSRYITDEISRLRGELFRERIIARSALIIFFVASIFGPPQSSILFLIASVIVARFWNVRELLGRRNIDKHLLLLDKSTEESERFDELRAILYPDDEDAGMSRILSVERWFYVFLVFAVVVVQVSGFEITPLGRNGE